MSQFRKVEKFCSSKETGLMFYSALLPFFCFKESFSCFWATTINILRKESSILPVWGAERQTEQLTTKIKVYCKFKDLFQSGAILLWRSEFYYCVPLRVNLPPESLRGQGFTLYFIWRECCVWAALSDGNITLPVNTILNFLVAIFFKTWKEAGEFNFDHIFYRNHYIQNMSSTCDRYNC